MLVFTVSIFLMSLLLPNTADPGDFCRGPCIIRCRTGIYVFLKFLNSPANWRQQTHTSRDLKLSLLYLESRQFWPTKSARSHRVGGNSVACESNSNFYQFQRITKCLGLFRDYLIILWVFNNLTEKIGLLVNNSSLDIFVLKNGTSK